MTFTPLSAVGQRSLHQSAERVQPPNSKTKSSSMDAPSKTSEFKPTPSPNLIHPSEIPNLSRFAILSEDAFTELHTIKYNIRVVCIADGRKYVLKRHVAGWDDVLFKAELEAWTSYDLISPHIIEFAGYILNDEGKIDAMVLGFAEYFALTTVLDPLTAPPPLMQKWVAQITHGLMKIHAAGIIHGDLRCSNVVLDKDLNVLLIDVIQGKGCTDGWCPWKRPEDPENLTPFDMYSLGATIWEILSGGKTPPKRQDLVFDFDIPDEPVLHQPKAIAERCLAEDPKDRPTAVQVFEELGGTRACGCSERGVSYKKLEACKSL